MMTEIEVTPEMIEAGELELAAATAGDVYPPMDVVTDIYRAMEAERRKGEKELLAHVRKLEAASGEAMDGSRPMDEIERTARVLVDGVWFIRLDLTVRHETDLAWLVYSGRDDDGGAPINVWLPKSQCENNDDGTFTMEQWLAEEKELV
tara:strand:+ start:4176 stop:4622 length:447 start_codon:yes stop_codon:yes gene_type:complete